ncbi:hypothetical protein [Pseudolactococcus insecticola]|uniref:Uncharacterized protein n=1 Tax=Pseudolactococcus insecticola TaxID=2709158 RepID=A0A6A0B587_9LACT|nr:hypothetical protein [Lactococcus insecticola]GFH39823.1 hypothetical protein Hs20B_02210 [Lactococcus insecticola]
MSKFTDDIMKQVTNKAKNELNERLYDVECPHCKHKVKVPTGKSYCSNCSEEIDLTLDFDF